MAQTKEIKSVLFFKDSFPLCFNQHSHTATLSINKANCGELQSQFGSCSGCMKGELRDKQSFLL